MSNLYFTNPGEIDIRGATIAGLSAKSSDTPIGFFGTGMKYAIACILRWGGSVTVYSGLTKYTFETEDLNFRGAAFKQIMMRSASGDCTDPDDRVQQLGFTTEYGKKWQPWQVFRELYANAIDEDGTVSLSPTEPSPGRTVIVVSCKELIEPYNDRDDIILPATCVYDLTTSMAHVMERRASFIFYRGVRVRAAICELIWNFRQELDLTEDRTLENDYIVAGRAAQTVAACDHEKIIWRALEAPKGTFEHDFTFQSWWDYSQTFLRIAERLYLQNPSKHKRLRDVLGQHKPELLEPVAIVLSPMRQKMLDRAIGLVARMGMNPSNFPIAVAELGANILGQYNKATGKIWLAPEVFNQGTKQVLSTLYEELVHAETGREDCNYDMQTFLFNTIVSLYEEYVFQEPV